MRKIILRNFQSPGDIVMLTAAVRDLHRAHPGRFTVDVRTPCPALWEHNPWIRPLRESDPTVTVIACEYPRVHQSNRLPGHFVEAFGAFLGERLGVRVPSSDFRGDVHLAPVEREWMSQVEESVGAPVPFWLVNAGGKFDFTAKWWDRARYQAVIDHFRGRILFVQVGEGGHHHPPLDGVLDLRGRTDLRQLVRLVHHAQGALTPVSLLMHLAAAVEVKEGRPKNRACVVVAGGREPPHWEAYPHHQYVSAVGALLCCDQGGCWKSRVVPLHDGDEKDRPEHLCVDVVGTLPRCMHLIRAEDVIRRIELYFDGGANAYLSPEEAAIVAGALGAVAA
jgi:ADP-heptose:LPS heptosyltransferase